MTSENKRVASCMEALNKVPKRLGAGISLSEAKAAVTSALTGGPTREELLAENARLRDALWAFASRYRPEYEIVDDPKLQAYRDQNTITPATCMGDFRRAYEAFHGVSLTAAPVVGKSTA